MKALPPGSKYLEYIEEGHELLATLLDEIENYYMALFGEAKKNRARNKAASVINTLESQATALQKASAEEQQEMDYKNWRAAITERKRILQGKEKV